MRNLEDPFQRERLLSYVREGYTVAEAAKLVGCSTPELLRQEFNRDPDFEADVHQAQRDQFDPVLKHAIKLSLQADVEGEAEGAHKAMALVVPFISKELDRTAAKEMLSTKLDHDTEIQNRAPALGNPEAVLAYMAQLVDPVVDAEEIIPELEEGDIDEEAE